MRPMRPMSPSCQALLGNAVALGAFEASLKAAEGLESVAMAPGKPRIQFRVMEGAEALGLRALRREFGLYGEVTCAVLRVDSARQPLNVEIEFSSSKATLKVKAWTGQGSHLPLYKPEGLVDAFRRDADKAFLCYADNFDKRVNSFKDLAHFAQYVTDWCSASLKACTLCWSPTRGVYAQMECCQKADQERVISKLMTELYREKRLSVSSVTGGDYQGQQEKSYRVDWSVVASEAAVAGIEQKEASKLEKLEKLARKAAAKMEKKKDKKEKKAKKGKKKKKEKKKEKKEKKGKKEKASKAGVSDMKPKAVAFQEPIPERPRVEPAEPAEGSKFAWETSSSSTSSEEPRVKKRKEVDVKALGPMAMLAGSDEESS